ncbi:alpha-pore-forming cytotoxin MakB [Pseudomonas rubra]|uniref:Uncharacterized protein n=1 Tax=Pseudomonas rubra TaxID=2942627 RepID=A0ABT5PBR4_9PSED|nr:hypothetical protein [Pseudomonas rubra]MDD1015698.1 hypothetical protein [Pseudomonas rubra]MDD1040320.1 hypothetical protein [Pseudomonas rubra]MDD1153911.1 hypothetical protein [Pseudomonas rubra]
MLSPSVNTTLNLLTLSLNEVTQLDSYAHTTGNLLVGKLPKDPAWLASVRSRVSMLGSAGASWIEDKPQIWANVLLQFCNYSSAIAGLANMQCSPGIRTNDQWVELLRSVLLSQLDSAIAATDVATQALASHRQAFSNIQPLLEQSINAGWAELASEEKQMVKIAAELQRLQDLVSSLQDALTTADISTGQSVTSTTVTMLYNVATEAGGSFSFLGMAVSAITVGKFYYDIISKNAEVADTLRSIATLQVQATEEAQAAAGSKMVLQLLYSLELTFASMGNSLPQISTLWRNERAKVQMVIDALKAGADASNYFDLLTLPTANANWHSIAGFARAIPALTGAAGPPVTLNPQAPIANVA